MMPPIVLHIEGLAQPAGSKKGFYIPALKRVVITDDNPKSKKWKQEVAKQAKAQYKGPLLDMPLRVEFVFTMPRPQCHFRTGKNASLLRDGAPHFPASRPDVLKLSRAVEDALTKVIWIDDGQIVTERISKRYGTTLGVQIEIKEEIFEEERQPHWEEAFLPPAPEAA